MATVIAADDSPKTAEGRIELEQVDAAPPERITLEVEVVKMVPKTS